MAAVDIDIADAVTTALNAASLSQTFEAVRSYAEWDEALEDFGELHVDVVPLQTGPTTELEARAEVDYTCEIDIGVRYRFGDSSPDRDDTTGRVDKDQIDAMKLFVQEIAEYFMTDRLADTNTAVWQETEIKLGWSRKHLRQMRQFFGFVRLTFVATRAIT